MIKTFKAKGTGIIEDVVINHRSGVSNWTNFPTETWNGQTWKIGPEGICCTDEVKNASGQATPTGAPDTGEDFDGSRDLDHTNANVQNNCKNYCKFLLEDMGYAGFRYDMVKGYGGQYTKIYNEYSQPEFSVGEYWDGSYDAVKGWIEATGKTSAAFDFPGKYAINKAFSTNNMTELVWKANGTNPQPAGMIHFGYPQYAVTFIDNHDTYRDGSKFTSDKVVAANAFILFSPGTPCIFLPHWKAHKAELQKLIALRNAVGIHNCSTVNVLKSENNCYMAEITGTKGKAVVKIGSAMVSPSGYSDSDIKASGNDYCVWSKVNGNDPTPNPTPDPNPATVTIKGDYNLAYSGDKENVYYWGAGQPAWPGVKMETVTGSDGKTYKVYKVPTGTKNVVFNTNGDSNKTGDLDYTGSYVMNDNGATTTAVTFDSGNDPTPDPTPDPTSVTITGNYNLAYSGDKENVYYWGTSQPTWPGVKMETAQGSDGKTYKVYNLPAGTTNVVFNTNGDSNKTGDLAYTGSYVMNDDGATTTAVTFVKGSDPDPDPDPTPDPTTYTIYYDNSVTNWSSVSCYSFVDDVANQGAWPGKAMEKVSASIYKITVPEGSDVVFNNNNKGSQTVDVTKVQNNHVYKGLSEKDGKGYNKVSDAGEYQGGDDPQPQPGETWYLVGSMTDWKLDASLKFSQNGNVFTLTVPGGLKDPAGIEEKSKGWKIWDGSWDTKNFGAGDQTSAASGVEINAWYRAGNNFTYQTEGETTIIFTLVPGSDVADTSIPSKIKVIYSNGGGGDDPLPQPEMPATLGVLSTPWNGGTANELAVTPMTKSGNTFTIDGYKVGTVSATDADAYVQFAVNTAATTWNDLNAGDRYGAAVEKTELSFVGNSAQAALKCFTNSATSDSDKAGAYNAFKIAAGTYDFHVIFNNDGTTTLECKVHSSGVENVGMDADNEAEAEYFNLQGVKVDYPSNGVYIRRVNGKASKVFVK